MTPDPLRAPGTDDEPLPRAHSGRIAAWCLIACALLVVIALWRTA